MAKTTRFWNALCFVFCAILFLNASVADARPHRRAAIANPRYASITMDAQTGRILDEQNAYRALPPASLTKLMTLFLTFEALEHGRLHMNKYINVSAAAVRQPPSRLGMKVGERITVKQAILALVTRSGNDVAFALAETIGGSEKRFTQMMTERARTLGMKSSYFANPSGLPHPAQKSSAYDMAVLSRALMQYFPQHYHFFSTKFFTYKGQVVTSHNRLMQRFAGMDGLKTGYVNASGFNLAASAVRNNRRVIVVVFGGRTAVSRDNHVADLMNRAFDRLGRGEPQQAVQVASVQKITNKTQAVAVTTTQTTSTTKTVATTQAPAPTPAPAAVTNTYIPPAPQAVPVQTNSATDGFAYPENWSPDGGQVKTLQAPQQAAQQLQPVATTAATQNTSQQQVAYLPNTMTSNKAGNWGIQVGAFSSPSLSQQAIQNVQARLKELVHLAQPVVVPTVTAEGTVYRARIVGLSAENAAKACQLLSECMAFTVR